MTHPPRTVFVVVMPGPLRYRFDRWLRRQNLQMAESGQVLTTDGYGPVPMNVVTFPPDTLRRRATKPLPS